jgi:hypothetical protein
VTDLRRWIDGNGAPEGAADLLRAARVPAPIDAATRARSRRRLAAMTAVPAAASVMFWFKSVALGAVLGSAVTVAIVVPKWRATPVSEPTSAKEPVRRSLAVSVHSATQSTPEPGVEAPEATPSATPSPSAPSLSAPSTTKAGSAVTVVSSDDLGREIQLLERARQLLNANPALALATLDEHRREFGKGTLRLERQFLEVDALLHLGRRDEARARAASLRARAPGSLYEQRLSKLLDEK